MHYTFVYIDMLTLREVHKVTREAQGVERVMGSLLACVASTRAKTAVMCPFRLKSISKEPSRLLSLAVRV